VMEGDAVSFSAAFVAGLLTFLSPCILPLIPAYLSYITGVSFDEMKEGGQRDIRGKTLLHALFFVFGFSIVFVALGASATAAGAFFSAYRVAIGRVGGALVIVFGLYLMGVFKIDFFAKERRFDIPLKKGSKIGSLIFGVTFAAAWTPCVGPILGTILVLAGTQQSVWRGVWLLGIYSLGIAIPFIAAALLINSFLALFVKVKRYLFAVKFICGLLLIAIGVLLIMGRFSLL